MSRILELAIGTPAVIAFLAIASPAEAGTAIKGYKPGATKAAPVAKKGVVVRPAAKKRFTPYKTYGFRTGVSNRYSHHHPIPGGGWCRLAGLHTHAYAPVVNPHWVLDGGGYVYLGIVPEVTVVAPAPAPAAVVVVEPLAPPPPTRVYVAPAPAPAPHVIWLTGPDCREKIEYKKDGVKYEYKCKGYGHGKHKGKKKGHHKHDDEDDDD